MSRLSVVVPGYRTPRNWWRRCVESLREATGPEDEILCVDDGDLQGAPFLDDESRRDKRIRVIHRHNAGLAVARNTALGAARGEWVTFVDSDDEVLEDVYRRTLSAMQTAQADIGLFGVRTIWVSERLLKEDIPQTRDYGSLAPSDVKSLSDGCLLNYACNKVYRKAFLEEHRLRFAEKGMPCEDIIFNLECIMAGARWCAVDAVGYIYYRTGGTLLSQYRPFNGEGLRLGAEAWRRYIERGPNGAVLFALQADVTGGALAWVEWDNLWRLHSPFGFRGRLDFLCKNRAELLSTPQGWQARLLRYSPSLLVVARGLYQFLRRWAYVRPVRRWHIRRLYPYVVDRVISQDGHGTGAK